MNIINIFTRQGGNMNKVSNKTYVNLFVTAGVVAIIAELIGTKVIPLGALGKVVLLPMMFAMIIGTLLTPDALGRFSKLLQRVCNTEEIGLAEQTVTIILLFLGIKLGTSAGPNILKVVEAGPALILQEFGNLGTMFLGLPVALMLGMRREAVGATVSICREPTLGLIGETYGINSKEGIGVMGTYITGTIFGTIFFGIMASLAVGTGIHPYALAMASGMGSGSMMTAASQVLAESVPGMKDEILAYAATSNIMTNITGLYMELFIGLPLVNKLYNVLIKIFREKQVAKSV